MLDAEEYDYKIELSVRLKFTREAFLRDEPDWFERLRRDISSSNLMNQYFMMRLVELGRSQPEVLKPIIDLLWRGDHPTDSLDDFAARLREQNPENFSVGGVVGFASILLLGRDPELYPPYRAQAVKKFLKLVGWADRGANGSALERYGLLLEAMDEVLRLAPQYGIALKDRLDAQGLMWTVMNVDPPSNWSAQDIAEFHSWRGDKVTADPLAAATPTRPGPFPGVESAAQAIIRPGLLLDPSPFGGGEPTWTAENAQEIYNRVILSEDLGSRSFLEKLKDQLSGAAAGVVRLAAELVALQSLPLTNLRPATKRGRVNEVLSWLPGGAPGLPPVIDDGFSAQGAFNGGQGFNQVQYKHLGWLATLIVALREADYNGAELLNDPKLLSQATLTPSYDVQAIRYSFEYMAAPWFFEPIVNRTHRVKIRDAFDGLIGGASGDDDWAIANDLHEIQQALTARDGARAEWYSEPYLHVWNGQQPAGRRAWLVRQNQGGLNMLEGWLQNGRVSTRAQHLGSPPAGSDLKAIQEAVNLGYDHVDYAERKQRAQEYYRFLTLMKPDDRVVTLHEESLYLGVITGEAEYAEHEEARLWRDVEWVDRPVPNSGLPAPLPKLLDETGVVVDLTDALTALDRLMPEPVPGDSPGEAGDPSQPPTAVVPHLRAASDDLSTSLHVAREDLQEIIDLLQTRNQIVFYGPPGTGKTFLATKIARYLTGEEHTSHITLVQFHPSYAYEDFFEGYRPASADDGHVGFALEPGPLRRIAAEAAAEGNRDKPFFLIIDEMNRGNLAKVFGELYFLLEYRNDSISLQYNPAEKFALPPNLFIIGTMNTADRSIAMVDAAIRRRFAFVELHPEDGMIRGMLAKYLEANGKSPLRAQLLDALNAEIESSDRDLMVGPSYFMRDHAETEEGLRRIWRYELLPLLEEHYFGRLDRKKVHERFGFEAILQKVHGPAVAEPVADAAPTDTDGNGLEGDQSQPGLS
ncbi:5-methylcytosine-specific restriction protein B [Sinomonas atrocyanea]|uniref:McrB family protein n=1 Tax=Sinomonas atrocyanea TaxID=37927 RepID=UPI002784BF2B|nr:AAA family ATPase [Sinomonas atrocyanea]MDQ0260455.1 5-methylcytosine-specific restriction protein B [Sinomonas atrocyanea]